MKQINEHTKLPWDFTQGFLVCKDKGDHQTGIAVVTGCDPEQASNGEFIKTACNNFYKMREWIRYNACLMKRHMIRIEKAGLEPLLATKGQVEEAEQLLKDIDND